MATKLNKRNTPLKNNEDVDPQTPSKVLRRRATRSASRSQSCETEDSANDVTPSKATSTPSTRRSARISAKRIRVKSGADYASDDNVSDVKILDDEKWEYDVPPKNFFNENPDDHVHGYSFKTPKKRDGMVALACNTPKTPKGATTPRTPKTPKSSRKIFQPKTPSNVRAKLQKGNWLYGLRLSLLLHENPL